MAKTTKTRKTRSPRPIPAMLEGGFGTRLENFVAEMNNQLAREGKLTTDPAYVMLREIRKELIRGGAATFDRGATTEAQETPDETVFAAPKKARKSKKATPQAAATTAVSREISEAELEDLFVSGTVSEEAPYGRDSEGVALAPYGVKLSGVPMKRRGRSVGFRIPVEEAVEAAPADAQEEEEEDNTDLDLSGVDGAEEDTQEEDDIEEDELDDLLANL